MRNQGWATVKAACIVAGACVLVAGCSGNDTAIEANASTEAEESTEVSEVTEATEITLMLNWTPNAHHAGIYLAEENGWYDEVGIDLTIIQPGESFVEVAVAEGAADIGIAQAESLLPARQAGADVQAIATLLPVNDSSLMVLSSNEVETPKDLEGLTYGGFEGALENAILSSLIECDGGDPSAVESIGVGNVDYFAGLQQGAFDVVWVFEGWDVLKADSLDGVDVDTIAFDDYQDCIPNWYTPLLLTASNNVDAPLTRDFLEATARGYAEVETNPQAGADALASAAPELDSDLVNRAVAYYAPLFGAGESWGEMDEETWQEFSDFLVEATAASPEGGAYLGEESALEAFTNEALPNN